MSMLHKSQEGFSDAYLALDNRYWAWFRSERVYDGKLLAQMTWAKECLTADELKLICDEYASNYGTDNDFYIKFKSILNDKLLKMWTEE